MLHGFKADRVMVSVSIEVNKTQDLTAMKSSTRSYLNYKKKITPWTGRVSWISWLGTASCRRWLELSTSTGATF